MDPITNDELVKLESELDLLKQADDAKAATLAAVTAERDALKAAADDPKRAATWGRIQEKVQALAPPPALPPPPA